MAYDYPFSDNYRDPYESTRKPLSKKAKKRLKKLRKLGLTIPAGKKTKGNGFFRYLSPPRPKMDTSYYLSLPVYYKMLAYARAADGEISGFGKTKIIKKTETEQIVEIVDVRIFKQVCSGGHTKLDEEALSRFVVELAKADEDPAEWNCWWHSHNTFGVFFSGTDDSTAKELSKDSERELYSICINKKGEITGRYDIAGKHIQDCDVIVESAISAAVTAACQKEVKEKVTIDKIIVRYGYAKGEKASDDRIVTYMGEDTDPITENITKEDEMSWWEKWSRGMVNFMD